MKFLIKLSEIVTFKKNQKLSLLYIILFIGIVIFIIVEQSCYNARKNEYKEKVEIAIKEFLIQKLQEDSYEGDFFSTSERKSKLKKNPDTVIMMTENGMHEYHLDEEKSNINITNDPRLRFLHSVFLSKHSLGVDSLYRMLQQCLESKKMFGTFALELFVIDENENLISSSTIDTSTLGDFIPCFDITIGYRNEYEIKGYIKLPWYKLTSIGDLIFSFLYWSMLIGLYVLIVCRRKKDINVLSPTPEHTYTIVQNVEFNFNQKKLLVGNNEIIMMPQTAVLFKSLLEAPDYMLTDEEIEKLFWSNKSNNVPRLHNAIRRLRRDLENVPSVKVIRHEKTGYKLLIVSDS